MKRKKCMAEGGLIDKASARVKQAAGGIADFINIGRPATTEVVSGGRTQQGNGRPIVPADTRPDMPQERNPRRFAEEVDQRKQARSGGYADGGIVPFAGKGGPRDDKIPVAVAGNEINVSDGEAAVILPAKTAANAAALGIIGGLIEATNDGRKPKMGLRDGGGYNDGTLPEKDGKPKLLPWLPEGGILRTPQGRQQAAQAITNAPAIGAPLTIGGGQPAPTAPSIYAPAYAAARQGLSGEGLRPDVGLTGPRAVPQQQAGNYDQARMSTGVIRRTEAQPGIPPPAAALAPYSNEGRRSAIGSVNASPAATPSSGAAATDVARQPQFPKPNDPVPSGTGFIRNNNTGAVTPVGSPSIASSALLAGITPASMSALQPVQQAAQPTDTNRYRQTAEKILLDESRGPGGGVAARLLMGMAGRAAGMDNDAARTANETQATAARAQQAAAETASNDSYRRASLGIQGREQRVREQESADKLRDTAEQRAARTGIADAIESGDEEKIKKAQAKGIAAGVLKAADERKHEESPYRFHADTMTGDQVRINQKTGETARLDRSTNTWQPVGASQPKQAPQAAIEYLRANPGTADQFQQRYGYLPK